MTDGQLLQIWSWSLVATGAVVVVAAVLLIAIRWTAGRILALATESLETAGRILDNTEAIWRLEDVRRATGAILSTTGSLSARAGVLADALEDHEGAA